MCYKLWCTMCVAVVVVVVVGGAPAHSTPRSVDLETAVNHTVCPIRVEVDEDEDRIPRRIKLLRCAPDPHEWCVVNHIPTRECCGHNSNRHAMECVEIRDKVLVKYPHEKDGKVNVVYDIVVGCGCLVTAKQNGDLPTDYVPQ